ncbi:unnamed protein product [Leptosia nina]|uniref:Uncharacterized protein n=1 Tax=Leptosia nina TaxID=320188 RepID=A0AAV1J986_9NEOP
MEATEFDASLGGGEHLPNTVNSFKFVSSRSIEIAAMTESILKPNKTKLIFQYLPVHMRRRVMSHNCKRLPKKLREGHMEQLKKSGLPPKQKRPSRKFRRRPTNLLEEYTKRQRRIAWLETHIWHAKRFHMIERWGYRLAYRPCDKAFRACYRASSAHCLLQDISYCLPIRITGPLESIEKMFSYMTNRLCGLSITAKAYLSGNRAGFIHMFKPGSYPFGYVGKVEFLWVHVNLTPELILFVHPSQVKEMESIMVGIISESDPHKCDNKQMKLISNLAGVKIQVLYESFNRFRLTGPKSHPILTHCLKPVNEISTVASNKWVCESNKFNIDLLLKEKYDYWSNICNLTSPSQLPARMVIGLTVRDPRWSRPKKRTKAESLDCNISSEHLIKIPDFASSSPLWYTVINNTVKKNAITNAKFIEHITKTNLVPGEINEDDPKIQSIPIVLIQLPGSQNSEYKKIGYGSGWDIIVPSGYGLAFWLTFVMFGARSGGLRETEHLALEMGECYFPPDSESGKLEEKRMELHLRDIYFKRPPSKRVNFIKLGISNPFNYPWTILLKDWSEQSPNDFFVLRDRKVISELQNALRKKGTISDISNGDFCLVPIYLHVNGTGTVKEHALICVPEFGDLISTRTICEAQHEDPNAKIRKERRKDHLNLLKKLRRKRLKLKKKATTKSTKQVKRKPHELSEYVKNMRELWVPSNINSVRHNCLREVMGYVSKGAFSFTESKCCAIGYVTFNALKHLVDSKLNKVLVRNINSTKYRIANIQIINSL